MEYNVCYNYNKKIIEGVFDLIKKYFLFLLIFIFLSTPVFAIDIQDDSIKQILSDYKDLSYRFDVGISYVKFRDEYSDIYTKTRRFQEANPGLFTNELNNIISVYNDANSLWSDMIDSRLIVVPNQTARELKRKYPDLDSTVVKGILGGWNPKSTILGLNRIATEKIGHLEVSINNKHSASLPTYGFKYADGLIQGCIFISQVNPMSNAYEVGLRFGDRIMKVNDMPIKDVETFSAALSGPEGSRLKLHIKTDESAERVVEITKTLIPQ